MPLTCSLVCFQVYKQKVKHLLYEHQENLTELKAEGTLSMKRAQKDHWAQETELRKEMRSLKVDLKEQELANEVVVKNLRLVGVWQGSRDWICVQSAFAAEESGGSMVCEQETASSGVLVRGEWGFPQISVSDLLERAQEQGGWVPGASPVKILLQEGVSLMAQSHEDSWRT